MFAKDIIKHARELMADLAAHRWERSPKGGIILPRSKLRFEGKYTHSVNGQDEQVDYNLIPTEGLNHILGVALYSTSKINTWYVAPFSGNVTPGAGWTAANFASTATEITSTTDGFVETTRQAWTPAAPASGAISNTASKAELTVAMSSGNLTVYGLGLLSNSTRGSTSGVLASASRFATARVLSNTDVWSVGYEIDASST